MRSMEEIIKNPIRGDIVKSVYLGLKRKSNGKYVWIDCPMCGDFRWVRFESFQILRRCRKCGLAKKKSRYRNIVELYEDDIYKKYIEDNKDILNKFNLKYNELEDEDEYYKLKYPKNGDIIVDKYLGKNVTSKYIWIKCPNCGNYNWKLNTQKEKNINKCKQCCKSISERNLSLLSGKRKDIYSINALGKYKVISKSDIPKENDKIRGDEIGKNHKKIYIWEKCLSCGKFRWVIINNRSRYKYCPACMYQHNKGKTMGRHNYWKGGRIISHGYILVLLRKDNPYYAMRNHMGYILEHRLIMAQYLGRCLESWEVVHHKNRIKNDNRIENLELIDSPLKHNSYTIMQKEIDKLKLKVNNLETKLKLAEWRIKELENVPQNTNIQNGG